MGGEARRAALTTSALREYGLAVTAGDSFQPPRSSTLSMRGSGRTTLRPGRKLRCVARQLGTQGAPFCDAARYPPYPPLGNPSSLHLQFHSHSQRQAGADAHSLTWGTEARRAAASVQGCQRGAPMYKPIPYTYAPPAALRHHQLGGEKARPR